MRSSASEEEIMVSLFQADQEAAAVNAATITTNFISFPEANNNNNNNNNNNVVVQQSLKPFSFSTQQYFCQQQQQQSLFPFFFPTTTAPSNLLSSHNTPSPSSLWDEKERFMRGRNNGIGNYVDDDDNDDDCKPRLRVSTMKMKRIKGRKKVREPRFSFKTMTDVDVLDDGYKWRKYGQKVVKNTLHPRSYYRCTEENCKVKKRVERLADDPRMVITTYEGRHAHSPSDHNLEDSIMGHLPSSHLSNFLC